MKKIYFIFTIVALTAATTVFAKAKDKDQKKDFQKAEDLFNNNLFSQALPIYLSIDSTEKDNYNLDFKIGVCYLNAPIDNEKSVPYLERAAANTSADYKEGSLKEKNAPIEASYFLGRAYHLNYQFDSAIAQFQKYKTFLDSVKDKSIEADVNHQIDMCNTGKILVASPVNIKVDNLGATVNSKYADYSPVVSADESTLIFTSRRKGSTGGKLDVDGKYFEDIYISYKENGAWSTPQNIGPPINTDGHEASIGLSVDGQTVFIYKDDQGDGNIYTSRLLGTEWTTPQKLNENINTKYWEPSASISADGNLLFFTSNRPGGYGGRDIYMSKKLPNGEWGKAINLGPKINTQYDEDAPYIHPDGKTLYFSSTGHNTMGGFDIFYSTLSDSGTWSDPVNMGYPVNSTGDDIFYVPTADGKRAYYSSFKKEGYGEKDIYMLTYPDKKEQPLTVYTGVVKSIYGDVPDGTEIDVTDSATGEIVGQYYPNSSTGKYLFILPPGKTYHITYQADNFLFQTENMEVPTNSAYQIINKPVVLAPIEVGQKIVLKNIFFASGQSKLAVGSQEELNKLIALMKRYPQLVAEISGHTDSQGRSDMNLKLSQKRAEAVVAYMVEQGIEEKRLSAKGYGDTQPIAINKNTDGSWNWNGMALNRRFEFKILSTKGELNVVEKIKVPEKLQLKEKK
ncbi:MAG: OmpA family protein [Bacteroidia bacterium]